MRDAHYDIGDFRSGSDHGEPVSLLTNCGISLAHMSALDTISDRQAVLAVKTFYDITPDAAWEGGAKPTSHRIRTLVEDLEEEAPDEYKTLIQNLLNENADPGTLAARAELCRMVLRHFNESESLKKYVDEALKTAAQPHMFIDPVTGAFIIFLVLSVLPKVERKGDDLKVIPAYGLTQLVKHLPAVISALPKELLTGLGVKFGV